MNFERIFRQVQKTITAIKNDADIYSCRIHATHDALLDAAATKKIDIKEDSSEFEKIVADATTNISQYRHVGEMRARTDVFMHIARALNYFPFSAGDGSVYVSTISEKTRDIGVDYEKINNVFMQYFGIEITLTKVTTDDWFELMEARTRATYTLYVEEHGAWTENFVAKMGDDISRDSFATFLRQRIMASVFYDSAICYPVLPPQKTAPWRTMRESGQYNFPPLVSGRDYSYRDIFIYEQYAIPGVVEASLGDTVIDAGAFIGDTTCYFSNKVGKDGKVFAFEILPESIAYFEENMKINNCGNAVVVPCALSDTSQYVSLCRDPIFASGSFINTDEQTLQPTQSESTLDVKCIQLDDYCHEHDLVIDFIKADIEGSEMSMLRGGAKTIARDAPTCAICLYHKQNDYWEIPQFLAELCPDYTFWFRCEAEPVLFAMRRK